MPQGHAGRGGASLIPYSDMELMICVAARYLENDSTVVVGTGAPCAAAMLAQKMHSPQLVIMFEAGGMGPQLPSMPISVGDSRTFYRGLSASSMAEDMDLCQRGMIDYTFLGGAQVDPYGNLNSTQIGPTSAPPRVRLPGSGGANDLASLCWRTMMITPQDTRRFVPQVDFITSPGYLTGPGAREAAGLPPGTGPYKVITPLAVLGFCRNTLRMQVESLHPGISRDEVVANTGFPLLWADHLDDTPPPSCDELRVLRQEVDPYGYILGRG